MGLLQALFNLTKRGGSTRLPKWLSSAVQEAVPAEGVTKYTLPPKAYKNRFYTHDSPNVFNKFSNQYIGSTTDEGYLGAGHYFHYKPISNDPVYGRYRYNVDLGVKNPLRDVDKFLDQHFGGKSIEEVGPKNFTALAKKLGYDAVDAGGEMVVFDPEKIAIRNMIDLLKGKQ